MFTSLHELAKKTTLMITIAAEGDDQLRVNVSPVPADTKTKASLPVPLSLVATPAEFDAEFIAALGTWQAPKRSLVQQVQDAAAPAGAAPKLPAPAKQDKEKGKPARKPRDEKPGAEQATLSGVDAPGAAAGDAAASADQVMAGDASASSAEPAADQPAEPEGDQQPTADAAMTDQAAPAGAPAATTNAEQALTDPAAQPVQASEAAAPMPADAIDPDAVEIKPLTDMF